MCEGAVGTHKGTALTGGDDVVVGDEVAEGLWAVLLHPREGVLLRDALSLALCQGGDRWGDLNEGHLFQSFREIQKENERLVEGR